jgi:hypothetical protein
MCWSGEASAILATIGLGTAGYSALHKMHPALWVTLAYFSLMEWLQAFTYASIDRCDDHVNQILTLLGYLHISFQPFFANAISMHFLPETRRRKIALPAYAICFAATVVMLLQLVPLEWAGQCVRPAPLCAAQLCSVHGNWHIAWDIPLNNLGFDVALPFYTGHVPAYLAAYTFAAFLLPFAYGVWRGTVFHLFTGPFLAWLTTNNANEWPAVWCLLSIGIIMLVIKIRASDALCARLGLRSLAELKTTRKETSACESAVQGKAL